MPCYLFTYHGYGTWMPDRPRGFVRRGEGILPPDKSLAALYRSDAREPEIDFDAEVQRQITAEAIVAAQKQGFRLHYISTESTHVHVLVSWTDERDWKTQRSKIKESFSRRLNRELGRRRWFSDSASRKQVKEQRHFDYLVQRYLPSHRGWKWEEGSGFHRPQAVGLPRAVGPRLLGASDGMRRSAPRKERAAQSVMLLVAAFSRHDVALDWGREKLREHFGTIQLESPRFDFSETDYYEKSMGSGLKKTFFAFQTLIDPGAMPEIKRQTNDLERDYAAAADHLEERPLNLDPGYIVEGKLVLASTKDHAHRIYLRDGIYAEVTLHFQHGAWQKSPWTYPDYQRADFQAFFTQCREYVKMCRRSSS
jgi:hypothetical protein